MGSKNIPKNEQIKKFSPVGLRNRKVEAKRIQNRIPQDVPLWHVDYFDLKAIKTEHSGNTSAPPLTI